MFSSHLQNLQNPKPLVFPPVENKSKMIEITCENAVVDARSFRRIGYAGKQRLRLQTPGRHETQQQRHVLLHRPDARPPLHQWPRHVVSADHRNAFSMHKIIKS